MSAIIKVDGYLPGGADASFAGRGHAMFMTVAGANPREKGIHDAAFGHYGATVAKVSFEHEYAHMPEYGAKMAADYAERLVACADAMRGIADPRAYVAAADDLIKAAWLAVEALPEKYPAGGKTDQAVNALARVLSAFGGAP